MGYPSGEIMDVKHKNEGAKNFLLWMKTGLLVCMNTGKMPVFA